MKWILLLLVMFAGCRDSSKDLIRYQELKEQQVKAKEYHDSSRDLIRSFEKSRDYWAGENNAAKVAEIDSLIAEQNANIEKHWKEYIRLSEEIGKLQK